MLLRFLLLSDPNKQQCLVTIKALTRPNLAVRAVDVNVGNIQNKEMTSFCSALTFHFRQATAINHKGLLVS